MDPAEWCHVRVFDSVLRDKIKNTHMAPLRRVHVILKNKKTDFDSISAKVSLLPGHLSQGCAIVFGM